MSKKIWKVVMSSHFTFKDIRYKNDCCLMVEYYVYAPNKLTARMVAAAMILEDIDNIKFSISSYDETKLTSIECMLLERVELTKEQIREMDLQGITIENEESIFGQGPNYSPLNFKRLHHNGSLVKPDSIVRMPIEYDGKLVDSSALDKLDFIKDDDLVR